MMIINKGKRIFDCLKSSFVQCNVRFLSIPQTTGTLKTELVSKSKRKKIPLVKNSFVGLFDDDYFEFFSRRNDNLPNEMAQFLQTVKNNEYKNHHDQLQAFAKCGFYQFNTSNANLENNFLFVDLLHLYEELDLDPALSELLEIHSTFIIPAIINYGSSEQKENYLNKLLKGEVSSALAMSEESAGSDLSAIKMIAQENEDGSYIINGDKNWVTNGINADFFVVVAKTPIDNLKTPDGLNVNDILAFIIDKDNSIQIEKHGSCGLNECGIAKLRIENLHLLPTSALKSENVGLKVGLLGLKSPKFITLICILNQLKKIISDVILHVNNRKQVPCDLRDNELVQQKLSNIIATIYSFESMLYMTADILDNYDTDTSIESGLLQIYGLEDGINALSLCMELLGSKSYDKTLPYEKLWRDVKGLSLFNTTNIIRLFVSMTSLEYAAKHLQKIVKENRNPLNYPGAVFKRILENNQFMKDKVKLNLHIYKNLHPSLKESAEALEYCIIRFRFIIEVLFSRYGSELGNRFIDLNRISDIALEIFVMVSVLRRSSHSYCIGLQNSHEEVLLVRNICYQSHRRAKQIMDDIMTSEVKSCESISSHFGKYLLNKKAYFIEHPLKHDI